MATSSHVKEKELFTCSICLEQLKSPRSLPCLHTFCFLCISEYIQSTERSAGHHISNYTCPVCRKIVTPHNPQLDTTQWVESLPHNFTISSLMDSTNEPQTQDCNICKRKQQHSSATKWCYECSEAFCDNCCDMHSLMKSLMNHKFVDIKSIKTNECGIDVSKISDACPVHSSKVVIAYCFDHKQLCCVLCVTLQHRKCEDVQAIEDITSKNDDQESFETNLTKIQSATENFIKVQKDEKTILKASMSGIESVVIDSVSSAKDKLDELLVVFLKEWKIIEDKHQADLESKLYLTDKLLNRIGELLRVTTFVRSYGSKTQLFIHLQKSKTELTSEIEKSVQVLTKLSDVETTFVFDNTLQQVKELSCLGKIEVTEKSRETVKKYADILVDQTFLLNKNEFSSLKLKKGTTIHLSGYDLRGGVCTSNNTMVLCKTDPPYKLTVVDVFTGKISKECVLHQNSKRLVYDAASKTLYISFYGGYFSSVGFDQSFGSHKEIKSGLPFNGGVCINNDNLYLVVHNEIKKMSLKHCGSLQTVFSSNTDCSNCLNGLAVDSKNERLLHTAKDFTVVCTTLDGKKVFSYKDNKMIKVTSVTVNSHGIIFAGDETGKVHLISESGKERRTILDKCEKIKSLCDIWMDKTEKTLFVCGNEYVELYHITH